MRAPVWTATMGLAALALSVAPVRAASLLIRGATVWVGDGAVLPGTDILVTDGRIAGVGTGLRAPQGTPAIDAAGRHVCPGFVDVHSHLGLTADELDETVVPLALQMPIAQAFWGERGEVRRALGSGVTTLLLAPGDRNALAGPCAAVKLGRGPILKAHAVTKAVLGEAALSHERRPTSMPELVLMVREALARTDGGAPAGSRRVQFLCDGIADAERAVGLARELQLSASILLATPSNALPDVAAEAGVAVIVAPVTQRLRERDLGEPARLAARSLKAAFASLAPTTEEADLRTTAALAVASGMPLDAALRALTLDAAEMLGVADRVGSLQVGKDGDLVITAGPPLDLTAPIDWVVVDGEIIFSREAP